MEEGRAERDALLREQMKVMPWERFEQLVFELAHRDDPEVRRLQHPDGGADTVKPTGDDTASVVWQAKRYAGPIKWPECEKSLERSIERWTPSRVIFAFPRDLSERYETTFHTRLVKPGADKGVEVGLWNQSELVRRLADAPDLKTRFFGREQEASLEKLDRVIKTGGKLEDAEDLVERARTLSEYAESRDPDFTYSIASSGPQAPAPTSWEEVPYVEMTATGPSGRVKVTAWPREGATVEPAGYWFTPDEAGENARREAVRSWARGEDAVITGGAQLRIQFPDAMKELLEDPSLLEGGTLRMSPGPAFQAEVRVRGADGEVVREFEMRPVPPRHGAYGALAGWAGVVLVEVNFVVEDEKHASGNITFSPEFGEDFREAAEGAALVHAFCTHEEFSFRSDLLFPNGIGGLSEERPPRDQCEEMEWRYRLYSDVALLEEQLGIDLSFPDEVEVDDLNAIGTAADVLRAGEGSATFEQAEGMVQNPADIPKLPDDFRRLAVRRRMVTYPIFGREVEVGLADYELPPLKVVDIIPYGQTPNSPARVVLAPEGDGQMRFRLVDWEPPEGEAPPAPGEAAEDGT
jgi:hypothetical protein